MTTPPPLNVTQIFKDPREFMNALNPLDGLWGGRPEKWIFRGHWDSNWGLVPSLYRKECITPFLLPTESFDDAMGDFAEMAEIETSLLKRVLEEFDRAGLAIPENHYVRALIGNGMAHIDPSVLPFIALAQHHGVPTRMLDWTTLANVAAYFGASEIAKPKRGAVKGKCMEVIAMHRDAVTFANDACADEFCRIVRAPRASNANLHAQSGLFTVCYGSVPALEPFDSLLHTCYPECEESITQTLFIRLRIPQDHAGALLKYLSYEGVTGATMFPGYDGAVRALREQQFY